MSNINPLMDKNLTAMHSQLTRALYWKTRELEKATDEDRKLLEEEIADVLQELKLLDDYA